MKKVITGLSMIVFGCLFLILWFKQLVFIIMGLLPVLLVAAGMIVLSAGIRHIENQKMGNKTGIRSVKEKLGKTKADNVEKGGNNGIA